jgi:integrase
VKLPAVREVKKERVILTDEEFFAFRFVRGLDIELRMLSLLARCEGGMRTGDLNRWDWGTIDPEDVAECNDPAGQDAAGPSASRSPRCCGPFFGLGGSAAAGRQSAGQARRCVQRTNATMP